MSQNYCGKNLLTKKLREKLLEAGPDNMKPICKFFSPYGGQTWLITGAETVDPKNFATPRPTDAGRPADDILLFGYADLGMQCVEWGPLETLHDMASIKAFGCAPAIERDSRWDPESDIWKEGGKKSGMLEPGILLSLTSLSGY